MFVRTAVRTISRGVIGNTTGFGPVILGSSPGGRATFPLSGSRSPRPATVDITMPHLQDDRWGTVYVWVAERKRGR